MFVRKIAYLTVLGTMAALMILFESTAALTLAIGMILIPVLSLPVNFHRAGRLRIHLEAASSLQKGSQATVRITAENGTPLPGNLSGRLRVRNLLTGEWADLRLDEAAAGGIALRSLHCGRLKITLENVRLYDCFGLVGVPVRCREQCHITVLPEFFETQIHLLPSQNSTEDAECYAPDRPGWDLTEVYQLRDYVPGDSPRQIHWKLSGKFDRLIVRDPGLPIRQDVLVFWERTGGSIDPDILDAEAAAVVSVCRGLLEQSVRFRLGWNETAENRCVILPISDSEELIGVLPRLLSAAGAMEGDTGAGLLLRTHPDELVSHMIYIANRPAAEVPDWCSFGMLTVLSTSDAPFENAIHFDPVGISTQLALLEV